MGPGQTAYLILVIAHFTIFGAGLLGCCLYTWINPVKPAKGPAAEAELAEAA